MTRSARLEDALRRGMGRTAEIIGAWCHTYRPRGAGPALDPMNRTLRLLAGFGPPTEGWRSPGYGKVVWFGYFDAAYTAVGDYVVRSDSHFGAKDGGVWFVIAQEILQPVLCVRTNRTVDILRPAAIGQLGVNGYGGLDRASATSVATGWPAAVLSAGRGGAASAGLPSDVPAGSWLVLLPASVAEILRGGDMIADDLGRTAIIADAELTHHGWRVTARQAST